MIPEFRSGPAVLAVAGVISSLLVAYALLRIEPQQPKLGMFLVSVLALLGTVLIVSDDIVLLYRDGTAGVGLLPAVTAVVWLLIAVGFVGYTARELMA